MIKRLLNTMEDLLLSKEFGWGMLIGTVVLAVSYGAHYLFN